MSTFSNILSFHYDLPVFTVTISRQISGFYLEKSVITVRYDLLDNFHSEHPVFFRMFENRNEKVV
jgi:hypothetical protein